METAARVFKQWTEETSVDFDKGSQVSPDLLQMADYPRPHCKLPTQSTDVFSCTGSPSKGESDRLQCVLAVNSGAVFCQYIGTDVVVDRDTCAQELGFCALTIIPMDSAFSLTVR